MVVVSVSKFGRTHVLDEYKWFVVSVSKFGRTHVLDEYVLHVLLLTGIQVREVFGGSHKTCPSNLPLVSTFDRPFTPCASRHS